MRDEASDAQTSLQVRKALQGDSTSLGWVVERFTPLLRAQASWRIERGLKGLYDPEDLVQDVWAVVIGKLDAIEPRGDRYTPVLVRYLARTLLYTFNNLLQKHIKGKPLRIGFAAGGDGSGGAPSLPDDVTGIVTRASHRESNDLMRAALAELSDEDREIIVLRGIEQSPPREIAAILGEKPNTISKRYTRALERLRQILPGSVFEDLEESRLHDHEPAE